MMRFGGRKGWRGWHLGSRSSGVKGSELRVGGLVRRVVAVPLQRTLKQQMRLLSRLAGA